MTPNQAIDELKRYASELSGIMSRFTRDRDGIHIATEDDPRLRQYVRELIDLFSDILGRNNYSAQISDEFNNGISNYISSPSYKCVENILSVVRAAITRFERNPGLLVRKKSEDNLRCRENIFIIHGRDEAKWRELKDVLKSEFRLNPIVLFEQPDAGCRP
jgi:hypothetical protein